MYLGEEQHRRVVAQQLAACVQALLQQEQGKSVSREASATGAHLAALAIWLRRSMRFSGTWPVRYMLHPMMGIRKLLVLEINWRRGGRGCSMQFSNELKTCPCPRRPSHLERPPQVEERVDVQVALVVGNIHGRLPGARQVLSPDNLDVERVSGWPPAWRRSRPRCRDVPPLGRRVTCCRWPTRR